MQLVGRIHSMNGSRIYAPKPLVELLRPSANRKWGLEVHILDPRASVCAHATEAPSAILLRLRLRIGLGFGAQVKCEVLVVTIQGSEP